MNAALCGNTQGQYVTAAYVHLDAQNGRLRYAAAGHPSMLLMRRGNVIEVVENGLLLAALESAAYGERSMDLEPGDRLMLYTDGLLEARSKDGKLFGEAALWQAMRATGADVPEEAVNKIIRTVQEWAHSQDDDLTVLVCDYMGLAGSSPAAALAD
jgi:sigma-B regulation protein RsbU (phosphoserine phosphatase)